MRRHPGLWLAATLLLIDTSASAGEVSDRDRFQPWTGCTPIAEIIDDIDGPGGRLTLDEKDIATAVRSRLRGARIFDDGGLWLVVNVTVSGPAFSVDVELMRSVEVRPKGTKALAGLAATWESGSTGTHGNNPNHILFAVLQHVDRFIDEYLRVNADACRRISN